MGRNLSTSGDKRINISPALVRAFLRAQLDAEETKQPFPESLSAAIEVALQEWLEKYHPEALKTPLGRPRKHAREE